MAITILISAAVSLTLVPMLCAKLLRHRTEERESGFARRSREYFARVVDRYGEMLTWVLDRQPLTLAVALGTLVLTVIL